MMMHWGTWGWGGGWWLMMLWMGLPLVLVVVALYLMLRGLGQGGQVQASANRALDILAERFARGEIDAEQYRRMKEELTRPAK